MYCLEMETLHRRWRGLLISDDLDGLAQVWYQVQLLLASGHFWWFPYCIYVIQFRLMLLVMTVELVMLMGKSLCECCRSVYVRDRNCFVR